jgi:hypothetical protein
MKFYTLINNSLMYIFLAEETMSERVRKTIKNCSIKKDVFNENKLSLWKGGGNKGSYNANFH